MKDNLNAGNMSVETYTPGYQLVPPEARERERDAQVKAFGEIDMVSNLGDGPEALRAFADTVFQRVVISESPFNPIPLMYRRESNRLGVTVFSRRLYGARVYNRTYGEYKRASILKAKEYTVATSPKNVRVDVLGEQIQTGIVTASDITGAINMAVDRHKVKLGWDTWLGAIPSGSSFYASFSGDVSGAEIRVAVNAVMDMSDVGTIVARGTLLSPLTVEAGYDGSTGFADQQKTEIHNRGRLGSYYGTALLGLQNWEDELYGGSVVDATDIMVLPGPSRMQEIARFAEVGGTRRNVVADPFTGYISFIVDFEDGAAIWEPKFARRLEKTS